MYSLVLKITHSVRAKDAIAVARGLYRVVDGAVSSQRVRRSSWMDDPPHPAPLQEQNYEFQNPKIVTEDVSNPINQMPVTESA